MKFICVIARRERVTDWGWGMDAARHENWYSVTRIRVAGRVADLRRRECVAPRYWAVDVGSVVDVG